MRALLIVKATKESEAGALPDREILTDMLRFNDELLKAGIMVEAGGLHPSFKGKRVRFSGGKPTVIDGPFAETKELAGGFWLWQVKSMKEAVEWLKRAPFRDQEVEIRPLFEPDDFGEALTPELREQLARQSEQTGRRKRS
jgi:hypothetical protein